jgi:hypothetical protein
LSVEDLYALCFYINKRGQLNTLRRNFCKKRYDFKYDLVHRNLFNCIYNNLKKECSRLSKDIKRIRLHVNAKIFWGKSGDIRMVAIKNGMVLFNSEINRLAIEYEAECILMGDIIPLKYVDNLIDEYKMIINNSKNNKKRK